MVSFRQLLSKVESVVLAPDPTPQERAQLLHLLRHCSPAFKSFLHRPVPKASDRSQVASKEVRLPNSPPMLLDDQDVQIALKLSDDLNLNEIDAVSLLVAAHQEWGLLGREPLEILRLSAGLWFDERRALITSLFTLLKVVVLDEGSDNDLITEIHSFLEELFTSGLRQRLITLIKELNREEPAGFGGPQTDQYVIDPRGVLVERYIVAQGERLCLCQCVALSLLVVRINSQEAKDIVLLLKDLAADSVNSQGILKIQIAHTVLFTLVISMVSDALSGPQDGASSVISSDASFRKEFQAAIMASHADIMVDGYMDVIKLVWAISMMLTSDGSSTISANSISQASDVVIIRQCLDSACSKNAFKFLLIKIIRTAAFQNDDQEMVYIYNAYLHKMLTNFLSHPTGRDKVKELKDKATTAFSFSSSDRNQNSMNSDSRTETHEYDALSQPFICLLDLVSEVYEKEPKLIDGNESLWNFVRFAGEGHTCYQTLVAFLNMLSALASSEEGAKKVYNLLQSKAIRSVGWNTLFNSLSFYENNFRNYSQGVQPMSGMPNGIAEGDAKALVAYLRVLQKVIKMGNPVERIQWFPDIELLFKLLQYEAVPTYLKAALRDTISTFVEVSTAMQDTVFALCLQRDLSVDLGHSVAANGSQDVSSQAYDMRYELNEIEARREEYPSTLSFIRLWNTLIGKETDLSDHGRRYFQVFKFVRDEVFGPFSQRAYANPVEKWELVVSCLQHFQMLLEMYTVPEEDIKMAFDDSCHYETTVSSSGHNRAEIPAIELMKDFLSGKTVFRNIMAILMLKVNKIIEDRYNQIYGPSLEQAIDLCLQIVVVVLQKDSYVADVCRPLYQTLDVILSHDSHQIQTLLEYVRYDLLPNIQHSSIKIMNILSGRMVQLVPIIIEEDPRGSLIEDYAACLEARTQDYQAVENPNEDIGFLILQLLINNVSRPAPNVTHFLLKFDLDGPVEKTILQPKHDYSCLRVILNILDLLSKREINAILHEFGFQLIYDLIVDPLCGPPVIDLLRSKKYQFFSKHLNSLLCAPLPKRSKQAHRISELQQRSWLLKIFAFELHVCNMDVITHHESCQQLVSKLFLQESIHNEDLQIGNAQNGYMVNSNSEVIQKIKVLEILDIIQFQPAEIKRNFSQDIMRFKNELKVDEILESRFTVDNGGVYYYSERGDRLIDLSAFRDKLWQEYRRLERQLNSSYNEGKQTNLKNAVHQLIRWGWKYNKNLEEQAAQLHMLVGWSHLVEVAVSRRAELLGSHPQLLYAILDGSLSATLSPDCSIKMAVLLTQVVLTCMAKLQDQRFFSPGDENVDNITYIDLLQKTRLSNTACHSMLLKLVNAILRHESSETLRRRQYAIMLSYFQYCRGLNDPEISLAVRHNLILEQEGEDDLEIQKIEKDQLELAQMNFAVLSRESSKLIEVIVKDATLGSEIGKAMAFYVLDALLCFDHEHIFLSRIQNKGLLQKCLSDINNNAYQAVMLPSAESIRRLYTIEAELGLLLRVSYHYKKRGAQTLFSMGVLEYLSTCRAIDIQLVEEPKGGPSVKISMGLPSQHDRYHQLIRPALRLIFCMTSLIGASEYLEEANNVVSEIKDFVIKHQSLFSRILRDDTSHSFETLEELELAVGILAKVWPSEEKDDLGIVQSLFSLMNVYFCKNMESYSKPLESLQSTYRVDYHNRNHEKFRNVELLMTRLRCSLISYLYYIVRRKGLRLPVSKPNVIDGSAASNFTTLNIKRPTLELVASLLNQAANDLEQLLEEKCLLFTKLQDINELSRHEVDEIIETYGHQEYVTPSDSIHKRRYVAMLEMSSAIGHRESLTTLLLHLMEHALNLLYLHFENRLQVSESFIDTSSESPQDITLLHEKMLPVLERLEILNEERVGCSLKLLRRLVHSLKSVISMRCA